MHIAICLFNYFPNGGLQRDFWRISQTLLAKGHTIEVFTLSWKAEIPTQFKVNIFQKRGLSNHARAKHFSDDCVRYFKKNPFDLILGFNKMAGLDFYYAADGCLTFRMQKKPWWKRFNFRYWQYACLEKMVFQRRHKTKIFCLCERQAFEYQTMYDTESDRIMILPPTLAPDRRAPDSISSAKQAAREQFKLDDNTLVLVFIATRFKSKGLDRVIKSLKKLNEAQLSQTQIWILGDDDAKPYLSLAQKYKVEHCLRFFGSQSNIQPYLLAANGLIHPARIENTGTVLLEAMILGVPVLTIERCGYAEHIKDHQAGLILEKDFNQKDWDILFLKFLDALPNPTWENNGLAFGKSDHLYRMPEIACEYIEQAGAKNAALA